MHVNKVDIHKKELDFSDYSSYYAAGIFPDCICVLELKEEVVYYDVCEDPEELQSMVHTGIQQGDSPAVGQLKRHLQTLETKRGNICARRAYLRNKKVRPSTSNIHFGPFSGLKESIRE